MPDWLSLSTGILRLETLDGEVYDIHTWSLVQHELGIIATSPREKFLLPWGNVAKVTLADAGTGDTETTELILDVTMSGDTP